jgi:hypothetical protein
MGCRNIDSLLVWDLTGRVRALCPRSISRRQPVSGTASIPGWPPCGVCQRHLDKWGALQECARHTLGCSWVNHIRLDSAALSSACDRHSLKSYVPANGRFGHWSFITYEMISDQDHAHREISRMTPKYLSRMQRLFLASVAQENALVEPHRDELVVGCPGTLHRRPRPQVSPVEPGLAPEPLDEGPWLDV